MGTIIVGLVLVVIVGLAVRSMVKDKKAGKSIPVSYTHLVMNVRP